jgi:sugar phosphate isomerase/epimerase
MRLGICCGPQSVEGDSLGARALSLQEVLREARADYFEMGVSAVMGDDFAALEEALRPLELRPEAFNSFVPATHRITGEDADHGRALEYCATAMERCRKIGGSVIVLGSAGARKAPEGFSHQRALEQFTDFCRRLGPLAQDAGITIAIEPLNSQEDNLVLSVDAGAAIVDEVSHPAIQLLADLFHMVHDGESPQSVARAGKRLVHTHIASSARVAPGTQEDDTAPYAEFFAACRAAGYDGRCSFEGRIGDFSRETQSLLAFLRPFANVSAGAAST